MKNPLHIFFIFEILRHKLISHMYTHRVLILKSEIVIYDVEILRSISICFIKIGTGTKSNSSKDKNIEKSVWLCVSLLQHTFYCGQEYIYLIHFHNTFPQGKRDKYKL